MTADTSWYSLIRQRKRRRSLSLEEKVRALREKIAQRQAGLKTYLLKGGHQKWYRDSLETQAAGFEYMIKELDLLLDKSEAL